MLVPVLRTRDYRRTTLSASHRAFMKLLAEAYFAHDGGPDDARLDDFVTDVDQFISPASKTLRFGLVASLVIIRLLPIVIIRKATTFDALSLEDRVRMLEAMERSRFALIAMVFIAWKTILSMLYFENPTELAAIGYPGTERKRHLLGPKAPARAHAHAQARVESL